MITKRITAGRLTNIQAADMPVANSEASQLLDGFSNEIRSERTQEYPLVEFGPTTEALDKQLQATGTFDHLFVLEIGKYRPGQIYRTTWGPLVHVDQVRHYDGVEQLPWFSQMNPEEVATFKDQTISGIDHVFFSKFG